MAYKKKIIHELDMYAKGDRNFTIIATNVTLDSTSIMIMEKKYTKLDILQSLVQVIDHV